MFETVGRTPGTIMRMWNYHAIITVERSMHGVYIHETRSDATPHRAAAGIEFLFQGLNAFGGNKIFVTSSSWEAPVYTYMLKECIKHAAQERNKQRITTFMSHYAVPRALQSCQEHFLNSRPTSPTPQMLLP
jgi:hypothetical protein